ncbi:MAG: hypothetical protein IPG81_16675 [Sandaracinaceae bacterium]|jgi:hypothetical protein|nr:hypothetical protein [Sandaracinaceae bacterium]MBP7683353.1 hypothetical protein [Deltaproteobacteria bacterium]
MSLHRLFASTFLLLGAACGRIGFEEVALGDQGPRDQGDLTDQASADEGTDAADVGSDAGTNGLASSCAFDSITVILDGDGNDAQAGATMATAVANGCATTPTVMTRNQTEPGLLDPTTFAPLFGASSLGVLGGDAIVQNVMGYLMMSSAPIRVDTSNGRYRVILQSGGAVLLDAAIADINGSHDYAVVQIVHDPPSQATVVATHGYIYQGTLAGAHYFSTVLAPGLPLETRTYFVLEWTDMNGDMLPNAADTYTLLTSG